MNDSLPVQPHGFNRLDQPAAVGKRAVDSEQGMMSEFVALAVDHSSSRHKAAESVAEQGPAAEAELFTVENNPASGCTKLALARRLHDSSQLGKDLPPPSRVVQISLLFWILQGQTARAGARERTASSSAHASYLAVGAGLCHFRGQASAKAICHREYINGAIGVVQTARTSPMSLVAACASSTSPTRPPRRRPASTTHPGMRMVWRWPATMPTSPMVTVACSSWARHTACSCQW
jgi:hypothetical protein